MQETEINLLDILFGALRRWRCIVIFAIICAIVSGGATAVSRIVDMNDEEKVERWQAEYEAAYGAYWAAINDYDRQISENERLAARAETAIKELERGVENYQDDIEDLEAKIVYYEALIVDYQTNIQRLSQEKEKLNYYLTYRKEQNENGLLMRIDPYDEKVYETYLRIDSGYQILPGNTYQNTDPTPELLQTYRLLVNSTNFYQTMIDELGLNTEVRYLTEVVDVSVYNLNSLRVRVVSDSDDWAKMVGEYISDAIIANRPMVSRTVASHTVNEYQTNSYSTVDLDLYSRQRAFQEEELKYETSIREIDTSILNTEADIRGMYTDIRQFKNDIEDVRSAIDNIPLEIRLHQDEISQYNDANYQLRAEQLKQMEKPKPSYGGYTLLSVFTGFVKYAIIGGVIGAIVIAVFFAVVYLMSSRILSSGQLCGALGVRFFGFWPGSEKGRFAVVDKWIDRLEGVRAKETTPEGEKKMVLSNAAVACGGISKILLCGGADPETISAVASAMKAELPRLEIITGGTIAFDPDVVRGMAECDAVVLVEQRDKSSLNGASQISERAKAMNKRVVGAVLS